MSTSINDIKKTQASEDKIDEKDLYFLVSNLRQEVNQLRNDNQLLFRATSHELKTLKNENNNLTNLVLKLTAEVNVMEIKLEDCKQTIRALETTKMFIEDENVPTSDEDDDFVLDDDEEDESFELKEKKPPAIKGTRKDKEGTKENKKGQTKKKAKSTRKPHKRGKYKTKKRAELERKAELEKKAKLEKKAQNQKIKSNSNNKKAQTDQLQEEDQLEKKDQAEKKDQSEEKNQSEKKANEVQKTQQTTPLKAKRHSNFNPVVFISNKKRK